MCYWSSALLTICICEGVSTTNGKDQSRGLRLRKTQGRELVGGRWGVYPRGSANVCAKKIPQQLIKQSSESLNVDQNGVNRSISPRTMLSSCGAMPLACLMAKNYLTSGNSVSATWVEHIPFPSQKSKTDTSAVVAHAHNGTRHYSLLVKARKKHMSR